MSDENRSPEGAQKRSEASEAAREPRQVQPAEEWGERTADSRTIATGGKEPGRDERPTEGGKS
jgi:hypothetical protein